MTTEEELVRIITSRLTRAGIRLQALRSVPAVIIAFDAAREVGEPRLLILGGPPELSGETILAAVKRALELDHRELL